MGVSDQFEDVNLTSNSFDITDVLYFVFFKYFDSNLLIIFIIKAVEINNITFSPVRL